MSFFEKTTLFDSEGNEIEVVVANEVLEATMENVIKELKIISMHLSIITDNDITKEEVE